ncbi:MAG TPA: protein phosphatase CheZ [Gammaproteobacteria bacterium]
MDSHEERLERARRLVRAIEARDERAEREAADAIARQQAAFVHDDLRRIAAELRDALCNVYVIGELARLARRELPDAQLRLHQVIGLTEEAAHRTLAAVEASLPLADGMVSAVKGFLETQLRAASDEERRGLSELLERIGSDAAALKARLSEVMLAQSFQDLTGQIIRRVADLVAELDGILGRAGMAGPASARCGTEARRAHPSAGDGPPLPGGADVVAGQQDVDALLAELGV